MIVPRAAFAAMVSVGLAATVPGQEGAAAKSPSADATTEDWAAVLDKATNHRRYALRRAAAGKLAQAGDRAADALAEFVAAQGANALPLLVVDAISRAKPGNDDKIVKLLGAWQSDVEFFWRSQALNGLARRSRPEFADRYVEALQDPAHMMRIGGIRGLLNLNRATPEAISALLSDADPRARLRTALLLLEHRDGRGIEAIRERLIRQPIFLDDAWGAREANHARAEVRRIAGADIDADDPAPDELAERLFRWLDLPVPELQPVPAALPAAPSWRGGVEIRSCRNGDLFVQFSDTGEVQIGLDPVQRRSLAPADWTELAIGVAAISGNEVHGRTVCDYIRVVDLDTKSQHKAAPQALPTKFADWLKRLAKALENIDEGELSKTLNSRLDQFIEPRDK